MGQQEMWLHQCPRCNTEVKYFWEGQPSDYWCKKCMDELDWPSNASRTMRPVRSLGARDVSRHMYHDGNDNRWRPGDPE